MRLVTIILSYRYADVGPLSSPVIHAWFVRPQTAHHSPVPRAYRSIGRC